MDLFATYPKNKSRSEPRMRGDGPHSERLRILRRF